MSKLLKLLKILLSFVGGIILGYFVDSNTQTTLLIEEKVVPVLVGVTGAVLSLYSVLKPVLLGFTANEKTLTDYINKNSVILKENTVLTQNLNLCLTETQKLKQQIETLTNIVKLGFMQNEELVKNGTATKINTVGEDL